MIYGTVKWFNDPKGFGFIVPDDASEDVFAHHADIEMAGHQTLTDGQRVTFESINNGKGAQAKHIRPIK